MDNYSSRPAEMEKICREGQTFILLNEVVVASQEEAEEKSTIKYINNIELTNWVFTVQDQPKWEKIIMNSKTFILLDKIVMTT